MKACIFDIDGTLLDSMGIWAQIDEDFLTGRGLSVPADYVDAVSAMCFSEAAAYTIARFDLPDTVDELLSQWQAMAVEAYGSTLPMKPGARDYLLSVKQRGMKLGIATSLPATLYEPALRHHEIFHLFDAICSTDEVLHGKTHPDVFLLAAGRLGVAPADCIVYEDIPQALASARNAGMITYAVYDKASEKYWAEISEIADCLIDDFRCAPLP